METKTIVLTTDELEYLTSMLISREKEIDTFLRMFPMNSDLVTLRENHQKIVGKILNDPKPTVEEDGERYAYVVIKTDSWYHDDSWDHEQEVVEVFDTLEKAEAFIRDQPMFFRHQYHKVTGNVKKIKMD